MNIFTIDASPSLCAAALDDKRVIKMALETAQMLCTALSVHGYKNIPYKPTHQNHPCTQWTAATRANWQWLFTYLSSLNDEYKLRFKKDIDLNAYEVIADNNLPAIAEKILPQGALTEFVNCSGVHDMPIFDAYKACLNRKWANSKLTPARWTNTRPPLWKSATS